MSEKQKVNPVRERKSSNGVNLSNKQELYDRDYFETKSKTASLPYSWEAKKPHFEIIVNAVAHLKPTRVLDIGCAKGFLVFLFDERGIEAYGIDVSRYAVKNAPDAVKDKLFVVDIENEMLPFNNDYFDLIIGMEILEHLPDFSNILKECNRVLKKGGYLFFTTPTPGSYDATHDVSHVNVHPETFWIELFKRNGFSQLGKREQTYFIKEFVANYKKLITLASSDRGVIKLLLKFGWLGKFIRSQLQVYVNFFSPWKVTELLIFKK